MTDLSSDATELTAVRQNQTFHPPKGVVMAGPGRVAIVTGASSGMGEALSRDLVSRGWQVAMADIQANEELSKELGENAAFFRCDVADYDSQAQTFQAVWDKYGRLDALCANAGIVDRSSIYILNHRDPDK